MLINARKGILDVASQWPLSPKLDRIYSEKSPHVVVIFSSRWIFYFTLYNICCKRDYARNSWKLSSSSWIIIIVPLQLLCHSPRHRSSHSVKKLRCSGRHTTTNEPLADTMERGATLRSVFRIKGEKPRGTSLVWTRVSCCPCRPWRPRGFRTANAARASVSVVKLFIYACRGRRVPRRAEKWRGEKKNYRMKRTEGRSVARYGKSGV